MFAVKLKEFDRDWLFLQRSSFFIDQVYKRKSALKLRVIQETFYPLGRVGPGPEKLGPDSVG